VHWKAQALKNAGSRISRLKAAEAAPSVVRSNQSEVLRQAAEFVADLIGEDAFPELGDGQASADFVAWYLSVLRPLFPGRMGQFDFWPSVIDEIARLPFGDEPDLLKPERRLPGQSSKPGLLALRRLRALEWGAYFKGNGARPMHFQKAIGLSFGAEWDAIRHWRESIVKVVGERRLASALSYAPSGYFIESRKWHKSICDPLWGDGILYRGLIGLPDMSDEVFHGEWEELRTMLSVHD